LHDLPSRAKHLRQNMTWHEQVLWSVLRNRNFHNYKFRRQMGLGNYIVDFVCFPARLIVELDGRGHAEQQKYDAARTQWLNSQGFRVVRFWNRGMEEDINVVMETTLRRLREVPPHPPTPSPARGEREKEVRV